MQKIMRLSILFVCLFTFLFVFSPVLAQAQIDVNNARFSFIHFPIDSSTDRMTFSGRIQINDVDLPGGAPLAEKIENFVRSKPAVNFVFSVYNPIPSPNYLPWETVFYDHIPGGVLRGTKNLRYNDGVISPPFLNAKYDLRIQPRSKSIYFSIEVEEEYFMSNFKNMFPPGCGYPPCNGMAPVSCTGYLDYLRGINQFQVTVTIGAIVKNQFGPLRLDTVTCHDAVNKQELRFP
jgi:hypothetical protein